MAIHKALLFSFSGRREDVKFLFNIGNGGLARERARPAPSNHGGTRGTERHQLGDQCRRGDSREEGTTTLFSQEE